MPIQDPGTGDYPFWPIQKAIPIHPAHVTTMMSGPGGHGNEG